MRPWLFFLMIGSPWLAVLATIILVMNPPAGRLADQPIIYPQHFELEAVAPASCWEI
jgi:hypothetical protein